MSQIIQYRSKFLPPAKPVNVWPKLKEELARREAAKEKRTKREIMAAEKRAKREAEAIIKARLAAMREEAYEDIAARRMAALAAVRPKFVDGRMVHTFKLIEARFLKLSGFTREELLMSATKRNGHSRGQSGKAKAYVRMAIAYWARRLTGMSWSQIAYRINRDHTTALYGARTWPEYRKVLKNRNLRRVV